MKYTLEEKMFMYKKNMSLRSPTLIQRAWRTKYVCSTAPSWSKIMMTAKQFEKTGSVINLQARKRNTSQKRKNPEQKKTTLKRTSNACQIHVKSK